MNLDNAKYQKMPETVTIHYKLKQFQSVVKIDALDEDTFTPNMRFIIRDSQRNLLNVLPPIEKHLVINGDGPGDYYVEQLNSGKIQTIRMSQITK